MTHGTGSKYRSDTTYATTGFLFTGQKKKKEYIWKDRSPHLLKAIEENALYVEVGSGADLEPLCCGILEELPCIYTIGNCPHHKDVNQFVLNPGLDITRYDQFPRGRSYKTTPINRVSTENRNYPAMRSR